MSPLVATILAPCFVLPTAPDVESDTSAKPVPEYQLVYKFRKGQEVHYEVSQTTKRLSRQSQAQQLVTDTVREDKHLSVVDVTDDGSFVLKTVFERVRMNADFGNKKVVFDSQKPKTEDPPGFARFRKQISKPQFHVLFEPTGKLKAVRRLAAGKGADDKSAGKGNDGSSFLVVFPKDPVKIGGTWREEYTVKLPISRELIRSIEVLRTYRLNTVKDGIAKISFASSLKTPVKNPEFLAKLVQVAPSGTIEFDIDDGVIAKRTIRVDKTVLNHSGPGSLLQTVSKRVEKRVMPTEQKTASTE